MKRYVAVALALLFYASILPWSAGAAPPHASFNTIRTNDLITRGPWVDPRAAPYNAIGDGVTDDTAALKLLSAAIQAGTVKNAYFGSRTYLVSLADNDNVFTLSNLSGISFIGHGATLKTNDFSTKDFTISDLVSSGTTVTATTSTPHGYVSTKAIVVTGTTDPRYTGYWTATVTGTTTFTYTANYAPTTQNDTGELRAQSNARTFVSLDNVSNFKFSGISFQGYGLSKYATVHCGYTGIKTYGACKNLDLDFTASGLGYGVCGGAWKNTAAGGGSDWRVTVHADDVGYPVALWNSGHNSVYNIWSDHAHRGMYAEAANNITVNMWAKNYFLTGVLFGNGIGTDNVRTNQHDVKINYMDAGSTEIDESGSPTKVLLGVQLGGYGEGSYGATGVARVSNIEVNVHHTLLADLLYAGFWALAYDNTTYDGIKLNQYFDRRNVGTTNITRATSFGNTSSSGPGVWRSIEIDSFVASYPDSYTGYGLMFAFDNLVKDLYIRHIDITKATVYKTYVSGSGVVRYLESELPYKLTNIVQYDFGSIPANSCVTDNMTVTGAATYDPISISISQTLGLLDNVVWTAWVYLADTIKIRGCNSSSVATADPAAAYIRAYVTKYR